MEYNLETSDLVQAPALIDVRCILMYILMDCSLFQESAE